ncbi:2-hydroxyacid dehydrogenase [Paraburkholderia heleia]|uniref:2-hydroxyacid dehydrogenase n=1 Tax=Paraburkholderia heleia TaxID=634127 RepID=UPI0005A7C410|nr:glyoxylate/hydroxypyruvate reductase A [Paraburkholderia heleia]
MSAANTSASSGTLVFYSEFDDFDTWKRALLAQLPNLRVLRADDIADPAEIDFALVWKPPAGFFARMTRLKLIVILGAGADSLASRDDLPAHVPITRISDPNMARMMAGYVLFATLRHARDIPFFEAAQRRGEWAYKHPRNPEDVRVAVLGLGELGALAASELRRQGLTVLGWSRNPKQIDGVACYAGLDALGSVLAQADIVVVMLPLTSATRGLLDRARLEGLRPGAALVNVSRGSIVDQRALTELLRTGHIGSATLDVFEREPLPPHDPLWSMPNVLITPHLASVAIPASAARQIADNLLNVTRGGDLANRVDMAREY